MSKKSGDPRIWLDGSVDRCLSSDLKGSSERRVFSNFLKKWLDFMSHQFRHIYIYEAMCLK